MGVQSRLESKGESRLFSGKDSHLELPVERGEVHGLLDPEETMICGVSGEAVCIDGTDRTETYDGDDPVLLGTDWRVLVVTTDRQTHEQIPYTEIDEVSRTEQFFRTWLAVRCRDGTEYRIRPASSQQVPRLIEYIRQATETIERVDDALGRARTASIRSADQLRAGRVTQATEAREQMQAALGQARTELDSGSVDAGRYEEIEAISETAAREEIDARLAHARTLIEQATRQADSRAYTGAYQSYQDARKHLEIALSVEIEHECETLPAIRTEIDRLDEHIEMLRQMPLARAKQSRERAIKTDRLKAGTEAWEQTIEHYRDLLTAGWGTALDFAGKESNIRFQVECAVGNLVDCRQSLAERHISEGNSARRDGEIEQARDCYMQARSQLARAQRMAKQYRAGDLETVRQQRERVETHLEQET